MYKIGIVGAGIIAKSHADGIKKHDECTIVAVADIVKESAEKIEKRMCGIAETTLSEVSNELPEI